MELRDYQKEIASKGVKILKELKIVYLQMQVRTGKTLTALEICKLYGANRVLFLTKKKAISSVLDDYNNFGYKYYLEVINDESMHLIDGKFDIVVHDEHHRFGAFPKTGQATKDFKRMFGLIPQIYLSGTPTPESFSQIFHQFWVSYNSPFKEYINFYNWAKRFVNVKQKRIGAFMVNDYSEAKQDLIKPIIDKYCISFTQQEAGFKSQINEHILYCEMKEQTNNLINRLKKDKVIEGKSEVILADTSVKMQQKIHQLCSGTIKFESGNNQVIDNSKAIFIKDFFKGKKLAIIYKFKAERDMLIETFGDLITENIEEFNTTNKHIIGQILSIREGVNLSRADYLTFLNIDFSATSYWQARDRMTTKNRPKNDVYFIFGKGGIEKKIYDSVMQKKDYTLSQFKRDYGF
jgi:hypothetical protein